MIISFSIENFRSIRENQVFSLEANSSKSKETNIITPTNEFVKTRLLKTGVIYGSNASGKSNFIKALFSLRSFILNSTDLKTGDLISKEYYEPFLLDQNAYEKPSVFSIDFIALNGKRHRYSVSFNGTNVIDEYLGVFDSSRISRIYERTDAAEFVEFGDGMQHKKENKEIPKNNLYISKFGNSTNAQMTEIYLYFKRIEIWNVVANHHTQKLYNKIQSIFNDPDKANFRKKLSKLINVADTKISSVEVSERDLSSLPDKVRENMSARIRYETHGVHPVYKDGIQVSDKRLSFTEQESQGTKMMFAIGGLILDAFENVAPTIIFLDEFNNSLHSDLAKFLIELFHNPKVNKSNAQLVFATHDSTLLENKLFRKDQIWFSEKNQLGETEIYSVDDFKELNNIRADVPFDKWYKNGKFGALPNIRKLEFISTYEEDEVN